MTEPRTAEQAARDLLERLGYPDAQSLSAGDVMVLANACAGLPPSIWFVAELIEHARRYGHDGDYVEIRDFVMSLAHKAGIHVTDADLEPYPVSDSD